MRVFAMAIGLMLCTATIGADDRSVTVDKNTDFSTLKTFAVHDAEITSSRPELSNPLFARQIADAVRTALTARGLAETPNRPDLVIDCSVTGVDYSIGSAGRANPIRPGRGGPRSFEPVSFTEGTLVIDLKARESGRLVWHGVYRRAKDSAAKLSRKLPDDVKKLFADFPPKRKK